MVIWKYPSHCYPWSSFVGSEKVIDQLLGFKLLNFLEKVHGYVNILHTISLGLVSWH